MNRTDQHFFEKLKDFEIIPSERANQSFNQRVEALEIKKKKGFFGYAAVAASLILVAGLGLYFYLNPSDQTVARVEKSNSSISEKDAEIKEFIEAEITVVPGAAPQQISPQLAIPSNKPRPDVRTVEIKREFEEGQPSGVKEEIAEQENRRFIDENIQSINRLPFLEANLVATTILPEKLNLVLPASEDAAFDEWMEAIPENKTLLAKLADEIKFIIRGEKFDADRAGIKPLAQEKTAFLAAEAESFGIRVREFFNY